MADDIVSRGDTLTARSIARHIRDHQDDPHLAAIIVHLCDMLDEVRSAPKEREEALEAAYEEGVEDGIDWVAEGGERPTFLDSVARVEMLKARASLNKDQEG